MGQIAAEMVKYVHAIGESVDMTIRKNNIVRGAVSREVPPWI